VQAFADCRVQRALAKLDVFYTAIPSGGLDRGPGWSPTFILETSTHICRGPLSSSGA